MVQNIWEVGIGTQQIEMSVKNVSARVLRMDADTTGARKSR
ncbi:MAG: hypothetical protein ACLT2Z_05205 [Eubacterium sp.]